MLGMFHLLPLLKGWEYKTHIVDRVVNRGETVEALRISETGWLMEIVEATDDAYGTVILEWQGADLNLHVGTFNPEKTRDVTTQGGMGYIESYRRPNPYSTAGYYAVHCFCGGYFGAIWPYVPTVVVKLSLPLESTQSSARVLAAAVTIAITDKAAFIRSLRRVLDPKASLKIDPALLVDGPAEFKEET
jgi:hypothetical protein